MIIQPHNHCRRPEVGHLLHTTKQFQSCDTFGRQTGRALDGCETLNASESVSGLYAPIPLTRNSILETGR